MPAAQMSIDPEAPNDFAAWAHANESDFLVRSRFGEYVISRLGSALRGARAKARLIRGEVVSIEAQAVRLAASRTF